MPSHKLSDVIAEIFEENDIDVDDELIFSVRNEVGVLPREQWDARIQEIARGLRNDWEQLS